MYNEEDTILDNTQGNHNYNEEESTILDQASQDYNDQPEADATDDKKKKRNETLKHIAINGGIGFAVGTLAAALMSASPTPDGEEGDSENQVETPDTPVTTDGTLPVAHSVSDSMSFGQAFRAAHDEVGPGGVFEWHGQLYNTYTEEEWNSLSHAERQEFNTHLRVVGHPDYASNVEHHQTNHHESHAHHASDHAEHAQDTADHTGHHAEQAPGHDASPAHDQDVAHTETHSTTVEVIDHEEPVVEVLGVEQVTLDDGSTASIGGAIVDGQQVVVIDVDNDGVGDLMASDVNGNGSIDDSELIDVSQGQIAMSDFETGGVDDTSGDIDYLG